jgi:hypothetical protein
MFVSWQIVALGLLVDDQVVAGAEIRLAEGVKDIFLAIPTAERIRIAHGSRLRLMTSSHIL